MRILILRGTEAFDRAAYLHELRDTIESKHGEVDVVHFDGQTASSADILDECRSMNLMGAYKIVVVDDAELLLKKEGMRPIFERYAANPVGSATLVIRASTWHPGKFDKLVEKVGRVIRCEPRKVPEAVAFCMRRAKEVYQCEIARNAATLIVERIGTDLGRLDGEIQRLAIMAATGSGRIDRDLVENEISLSREEKAWIVQDAVLSGHPGQGMAKVLDLLRISHQPPEVMFYALADLARKLYAASSMLRERQSAGEIASRLRLYQGSVGPVIAAAQRVSRADLARLVDEALRAAVRPRQGLGNAERSVEMLAARFVTTLASERR